MKIAVRGGHQNAAIQKRLQRAMHLADDLSREMTRACRGSVATVNMADAIVRELATIRELLRRR